MEWVCLAGALHGGGAGVLAALFAGQGCVSPGPAEAVGGQEGLQVGKLPLPAAARSSPR